MKKGLITEKVYSLNDLWNKEGNGERLIYFCKG